MERSASGYKYVLEETNKGGTPNLSISKTVDKQILKPLNKRFGDVLCDNTPRCHWSLGQTVKVYPGKDGTVRSVKVKNPNSKLITASKKLCLF